MRLSICMMVKNEEKNIKRCLESLMPLTKEIESEIIIIDTGSEDNTVEIAREYTKNIYFHKWNSDFSSMRNISISYAKGQWIFIIDADEELENCKEISAFLNSKLAFKYKTIMIDVKNYTSIEKDEYCMLASPRLFLNDGNFKYEGRVHNKPIFSKPMGVLDVVLKHYGYIETDKELMERKFLRTSNILIEELNNNPQNIYYNYQLAISYAMHKEYDNALKQMKKTFKIIEDEKLDKKLYVHMYYELASYHYFAGDSSKYKIIEQICKEGLEFESEYIDLYYILGKIYILTLDYEKAKQYYHKYLELLNNIDNLEIVKNPAFKIQTLVKEEDVYYDLSLICHQNGEYNECLEYSNKLHREELIYKSIAFVVEAYIKMDKYKQLKKFYSENIYPLENQEFFSVFYQHLEFNADALENSKKYKLISNFSDELDTYSFLNKIRIKYYENPNSIKVSTYIEQFIKKLDLNCEPDFFGDLIYYKIKQSEDVSSLLYNVSESSIKRYLKYICKKYSDSSEVIQKYLNNFVYQSNFVSIRLNKVLTNYILILDSDNEDVFSFNFKHYVSNGIEYVKTVYNLYILDNEMIYDVKNDEDAFFIFMYKANEVKNYNEKEYIRYLRKALATYPFMKKGIEMLRDEINNDLSSENKEFEQYKLQIKSTIKNLIINNKLNDAKKLIEEYEKIVQNDLEIVLFKSEITVKEMQTSSSSNVEKYKM